MSGSHASEPLFDEHWYRVKDLKPRLASDVVTRRHVYRGIPYYVLHRQSNSTFHRARARAFELIVKLDGNTTVGDLWQMALENQADDAPTQTALMALLSQLHEVELITVNRRLDTDHLFSRGEANQRREFKQRFLNPLFLRFSLLDPEAVLNWLYPRVGWLFSRPAAIIWLSLVLLALSELAPHWSMLRYEMAQMEFLSATFAIIFLFTYPALKLLHELAHGLMIKHFGGEVHECGMALMILLPIPYVDASSTALLQNKYSRMLVAAAGILVELGVAAIATLVWVASDGLLHNLALTLMLTGGLSTLIFNANPLLKFDGYYMLADWLEIPNLAQRSTQFLCSRAKSCLFGQSDDLPIVADRREAIWLVSYAVLSTIYRAVLMLSIAWMLSGEYFFFGVLLSLWVIVMLAGQPLWRFTQYLRNQSPIVRFRALSVTCGALASVVLLLFFIPMPHNTISKGVVWLPDNAIIRVSSDCEVGQAWVKPGTTVIRGELLFDCVNPDLDNKLASLQAQLDEVNARYNGLDVNDRVDRLLLANEADALQRSYAHQQEKLAAQQVIAESDGRFVVTGQSVLQGRYFSQGMIAAYIVPSEQRTVRMAVQQSDSALLAESVLAVELKFAESLQPNAIYQSGIFRQTPRADILVPSAALSTAGGGDLLADPQGDGTKVIEPVFDVELKWPRQAPAVNVGSHVYVKLVHPAQPWADRIVSQFKRAFQARVGA